jgi:hypothetical protein
MWSLWRLDHFLRYRIPARGKLRLRYLEEGKADVTEIPEHQFLDAVTRANASSQN